MFKQVTARLYRRTTPSPGVVNWGSNVMHNYTYRSTFTGSVQPFTGDEGIHSDQLFANVRDLFVVYNLTVDIKQDDEIEYGGEKRRVQFVQRCDSGLIPHTEVFLSQTQWLR